MSEVSVFNKLSKISVEEYVEQKGTGKNAVSYLSWAVAWSLLKKTYPNAFRTQYENEVGINYFTDGRTAYVKVGVTVEDKEEVIYLPVMGYKLVNRGKWPNGDPRLVNEIVSLPIDEVSSLEVSNTIMRATVKAIAMHGLGIELWLKEDMGEPKAKEEKAAPAQPAALKVGDTNWKENIEPWIIANKKSGLEGITSALEGNYAVTIEVKEAITKLIK